MQELNEIEQLDEIDLNYLTESTVHELMQTPEYQGIGIDSLFQLWSFSNDWIKLSKQMSVCKMTLPFESTAAANTFIDNVASSTPNVQITRLGSNGAKTSFSMPIKKGMRGVLMHAAKRLWNYNVQGVSFSSDGKSWQLNVNASDESVAMTTWVLMSLINDMLNQRELQAYAKSIMNVMKTMKRGNANRDNMDSVVKQLSEIVLDRYANEMGTRQPIASEDEMPSNYKESYLSTVQKEQPQENQQRQITKIMFTGEYNDLKKMYAQLLHKQPDDLDNEELDRIDSVCVAVGFDKSTPEMKRIIQLAKVDVEAGENGETTIRDVIQSMIDNRFGIAMSNIQARAYLTKQINSENERRRKNGEQNVPADEKVPSLYDEESISSILSKYQIAADSDEQARIERAATHEVGSQTDWSNMTTNPVAKRRLKLFEDIQHLPDPPKVYRYGHWICAVCTKPEHDWFWTRTKPKVYADGPKQGQIIENTNKRDDELDAMDLSAEDKAMYKAIRDWNGTGPTPTLYEIVDGQRTRVSWAVVNDGLGLPVRGQGNKTSNDLRGEVYWCTAGALDLRESSHGWHAPIGEGTRDRSIPSFWFSYNKTETSRSGDPSDRNPYWVSMDLNNGILYQHARMYEYSAYVDHCLAETDMETDTNGHPLGTADPARCAQAFLGEPDYKAMMNDIRSDSFTRRLEELKRSANVTNDGYILIHRVKDIRVLQPLLADVDGYHKVKLVGDDFMDAFYGQNVSFLTDIDLEGVRRIDNLFAGAKIAGDLHIHNMDSVVYASGMFEGAKGANSISGIDLRNAVECYHMFNKVTTAHNLNLFVDGNFDMSKCKSIASMFAYSPFAKLPPLKNCDNVTQIEGFFKGCSRLEQFPNVKFPRLRKDPGAFKNQFGIRIQEIQHSINEFTMGITRPFKQDPAKVQAWIKEMVEYYNQPTEVEEVVKNNRRLLVISSTDTQHIARILSLLNNDFETGTNKYDGITFKGITDGSYLFDTERISYSTINGEPNVASSAVLKIKTFDFGSLTKAECIFKGVDIDGISEFTGTESLTSADKLFAWTKVHELPPIALPNARSAYLMFLRVTTLDVLPKITIGPRCETNFVVTDATTNRAKLRPLFGYDNLYDEDIQKIDNRLGLNRVFMMMGQLQSMIDAGRVDMLRQAWRIDENGIAHVNYSDMSKILDTNNVFATENKILQETLKSIAIEGDSADSLFAKRKIEWLPPIDMQRVVTCKAMFHQAILGKNAVLKLLNTQNVKTCANMFLEAEIYIPLLCLSHDMATDDSWSVVEFKNCEDYENFMSCAIFKNAAFDIYFISSTAKNLRNMFSNLRSSKTVYHRMTLTNPEADVTHMFYLVNLKIEDLPSTPNWRLSITVPNADNMFFASKIDGVRQIEFSDQCKSARNVFADSEIYTSCIRLIDFANVENIRGAFNGAKFCSNDTIISRIKAHHANNAINMFNGTNIDAICFIDMPNLGNGRLDASRMFHNSSLTDVYGENAEHLISAREALAQLARAAQTAANQPAQAEQPTQEQAAQEQVA